MKNIRLTVAKYQENTDWIFDINVDEVYIYNKNTNLKKFLDCNEIEKNKFDLCNIGNESHTYLLHIVNNYENLFDVEIFTQGRPHDHMNFENFKKMVQNKSDIIDYGFLDFSLTRKYLVRELSNYDNIKNKFPYSNHVDFIEDPIFFDVYDKVWGNTKKYTWDFIDMGAHGIFGVSKETILQHPKKIYIEILNLFNPDLQSENEIIHNGYFMEHFWRALFGGNCFKI